MDDSALEQKPADEKLLSGVALAAEALLTPAELDGSIMRALAFLGRGLDADRVSVFSKQPDIGTAEHVFCRKYEWLRDPGLPKTDDSHASLPLPVRLPRWHAVLFRGDVVQGAAADFSPEERTFLEPLGTKAILAAPIMREAACAGFVCFHDCRKPRGWTPAESAAARGMAACLGAALARGQADQAARKMMEDLRASERRLHAVVEKLPVGVWLTDAQGKVILCNPAGQRIWGGGRLEGIEQYSRCTGWWHGTGRRIQPQEWAPIRALTHGETYLNEIIDIETLEGARKIISHSAIPIRDESNRIRGIVIINEDITERQRAEQRMHESEERHRSITQALSDYVYTVRVQDGRAASTEHGAACEAVTGYTSDDLSSNPYLWLRMVLEADRPAVIEQGRRLLAGEPAGPIEHRIIRKDNQLRWVRNTPVPHRDAQGKLLYYDGVIEDITDRREAENALRLAQFAMDHCSIPLFWIQPSGRFSYVNEAAARALGYSREQLLYLGVPDINPDFPVAGWPKHWDELKQHKTLRFESRYRTRDGRIFPVEITANYMAFGGQEYNFSFAVDISERRRAEDSLLFTQFAVDSCSIPAYWVDAQAGILYANAAACQALGYAREEILKMKAMDLNPRLTMADWRNFWQGLKAKRTMVVEGLQRAKDGRVFPAEITSGYLEHNGQERCFSFVQDITLRKSSEEAQGS